MSNFHYFATVKPPTMVISATTLTDHECLENDKFRKTILVLARSRNLDFYQVKHPCVEDDQLTNLLRARFLFSTCLYTPITGMIPWVKCNLDRFPSNLHIEKNPPTCRCTETNHEGLILLSESLNVYLGVPRYKEGTFRLFCTLNLNDYPGYFLEKQPLLAMDDNCRFLLISVYKEMLYLTEITCTEAKDFDSEEKWMFQPPIVLRSPSICPISISFARLPLKYFRKFNSSFRENLRFVSKSSSCYDSNTKTKIRRLAGSLKKGHFEPNITHEVYDTNESCSTEDHSIVKSHNITHETQTVINFLFESGSYECREQESVARNFCSISLNQLMTKDFDTTVWEKSRVVLPDTSLYLQSVKGGFYVFCKNEVLIYSQSNSSTLQLLKTLDFKTYCILQSPICVQSIDIFERQWLVGDATGLLVMLFFTNSSGTVVKTLDDISLIKVSYAGKCVCLGSFNPVSCLALCHTQCLPLSNASKKLNASAQPTQHVNQPLVCTCLILMGSKTGDTQLLTCSFSQILEKANDLSNVLQLVQRLPSLNPIVDFILWRESETSEYQFALGTGYSKTGCLRFLCKGFRARNLYTTCPAASPCRLALVARRSHDTLKSMLLFQTSPFHPTSVHALTRQANVMPKLDIKLETSCPDILLSHSFLYMANIGDSFIVQVTQYFIHVVDSFSLLPLVSLSSNTILDNHQTYLMNPCFENVAGDATLLTVSWRCHVYLFEFSFILTRYQCKGKIVLEEEVKAVDVFGRDRLIVILDWNGRLALYQWTQPLDATEDFQFLCLFSHYWAYDDANAAFPHSVMFSRLEPRLTYAFQLTTSENDYSTVEYKSMHLLVGFSNGFLHCLTLQSSNTKNYILQEIQKFSLGGTPVSFRPFQYHREHRHVTHGVLALCDHPAFILQHYPFRFSTVPLQLDHTDDAALLDLESWNYAPFVHQTNSLPRAQYFPHHSLTTEPHLIVVAVHHPKKHLHEPQLSFFVIHPLEHIQMKTLPIGVSPERLAYSHKHSLIVVAAVDETLDASPTFEPSGSGCLLLVDPQKSNVSRFDLQPHEYPSALICIPVTENKIELVVLGTTLFIRESRGYVRFFYIHSNNTMKLRTTLEHSSAEKHSQHKTAEYRLISLASEELEAVNALAHTCNVLLIACLNKITFYSVHVSLKSNDSSPRLTFHRLSVYSTHCSVHSIDTFQNYILMAYVSRSVGLYKLDIGDPDKKSLALKEVALDRSAKWCTATSFTSSYSSIYMTDDRKNLYALSYEPLQDSNLDTLSPGNLGTTAAFPTGQSIYSLLTVPLHNKEFNLPTFPDSGVATRKTYWSSSQGAFGVIFSLTKQTFDWLLNLETVISAVVDKQIGISISFLSESRPYVSYQALNCSIFNEHHSLLCSQTASRQGFIDGDTVERFLELSRSLQEEIFRRLHQIDSNQYADFQTLIEVIEELHYSHL